MSRSASAVLRRLLDPAHGRPLAAVELRFGTDVTQSAVEALLSSVAGLHRQAAVSFETIATTDAIRHVVRGDQATLDTVCGQLRGLLPTCRVEPAPPAHPYPWRLGAGLSWRRHALLRTDAAAEAATGLLAALGPLSSGEALLVRVVLRPGRPVQPPEREREQARPGGLDWLFGPRQVNSHLAGAVRARNAGPLVQASMLIAVACGHPGRAAHLRARPTAIVRARRGAHGELRVHRLQGRGLARAIGRLPAGGDLLSVAEVAPLIGWPIGAPRIPGLSLGASPLLMVDRRIPDQGRVLGVATWPGAKGRALAQPVLGACSHTLVCGPTGSGKSTLLEALIGDDLRQGRGCIVLDGKGDLVESALGIIPPERVDDVIVLDPASHAPVPGLRVFGRGSDPELTADVTLNLLRQIFHDHWGPRSDQWLRAGLVTLAHDPESTLGDLPFLFSDDVYRRRLVGGIQDPLLRQTWASFEAMKSGERANQLGAPLQKLSELLGRRVLRTVLSQPDGALDLTRVLHERRVVLASLAPGRLGAPASRLLSALLLHTLFSAVQARAALPATARTPFMVYVDEPRALGDLPLPLDGMLELARGMGVGLTIAAQSPSVLPGHVRQAALVNAATLIAYRQTADDADLLARHLPGVSAEGLQHLGAFEIIARIGLGPGEIAAPVSARTLPAAPLSSNPTAVRHASSQRYGTDPKSVDRALADRHHQPADRSDSRAGAPIGRRRRTP